MGTISLQALGVPSKTVLAPSEISIGTTFTSIMTITLPDAGTYLITGGVRATQADGTFVVARLFNQTDSVAITDSEVLVSLTDFVATFEGQQATVPIQAIITVTVPTVIRLEAREDADVGSTISSSTDGRTWLAFQRT